MPLRIMSETGTNTDPADACKKQEEALAKTPLGCLGEQRQRQAAPILWFILIAVSLAFYVKFKPLATTETPGGIIAFELPAMFKMKGTIPTLHLWQLEQSALAELSLKFDFLYILIYSATLSNASVLVARRMFQSGAKTLGKIGIILSWAVILAALFDCSENYYLLNILAMPQSKGLPDMAWAANMFAVMKFALLLLTLSYFFIAFVEKIVTLFCGSKD